MQRQTEIPITPGDPALTTASLPIPCHLLVTRREEDPQVTPAVWLLCQTGLKMSSHRVHRAQLPKMNGNPWAVGGAASHLICWAVGFHRCGSRVWKDGSEIGQNAQPSILLSMTHHAAAPPILPHPCRAMFCSASQGQCPCECHRTDQPRPFLF
jgi:hypothetical protein